MGRRLSKKTPRGAFALSGGRFPLNTEGRRRIAPLMAKRSLERGTITQAQYQKVVRLAHSRPAGRRSTRK